MLIQFDIQTLTLTYGWLLIGLGLIPLYIGVSSDPAERNLILWSASQLLFGICAMLVSVRPVVPDWLGYYLVGPGFMVSMLLKCYILERLGHRQVRVPLYAVLAVSGVAIFWWLHNNEYPQERIIFMHLYWLATAIWGASLAHRLTNEFTAAGALLMGFLLLLMAAFGNALVVLFQQFRMLQGTLDLLNALPILLAMLSAVALTVGYLNFVLRQQEFALFQVREEKQSAEETVGQLSRLTEKLEQTIIERDEMLAHLARLGHSLQLDSFASTLLHEINQPCSAIRLNLDYLKQRIATKSGDFTEYQELIDETIWQIQQIGETIVSVRQLVLKQTTLDGVLRIDQVFDQIRRSFSRLAELKDVELIIEESNRGAEVVRSPTLLNHVLNNVLLNALESIERAQVVKGQIVISRQANCEDLELCIDDNGPGVSAIDLERILIPFYSDKDHGTGLGLPISKTIMQRLNGDLTLDNSPMGGLRVVLRLPVS